MKLSKKQLKMLDGINSSNYYAIKIKKNKLKLNLKLKIHHSKQNLRMEQELNKKIKMILKKFKIPKISTDSNAKNFMKDKQIIKPKNQVSKK